MLSRGPGVAGVRTSAERRDLHCVNAPLAARAVTVTADVLALERKPDLFDKGVEGANRCLMKARPQLHRVHADVSRDGICLKSSRMFIADEDPAALMSCSSRSSDSRPVSGVPTRRPGVSAVVMTRRARAGPDFALAAKSQWDLGRWGRWLSWLLQADHRGARRDDLGREHIGGRGLPRRASGAPRGDRAEIRARGVLGPAPSSGRRANASRYD